MNPENTRLNAMPSFRANDDEMLFDIFVFTVVFGFFYENRMSY